MPSLTPARGAVAALALTALLAAAGCASTPAAETGEPADDATRSVEHARGTAEVPEAPQRVVVLEPVQLDTAVALGVTPVGAAVLSDAAGIPAYLGEAAAGIESVGTVMEPSVEAIAALEPDLIIGTESRHAALFDQLETIAPTVYMATQTDPWQQNVALVAEALGDAEGADRLLADYEARCAKIAEQFDTAGSTAQLVRPRDGILTLYGPDSFAGSALECAGFTTPERAWEDISLDVSPENVLDASADLVLVTTTDVDDPATLPRVIADNAAAFPELHLVDQSFWITGVGPLGGMTVLDDLERLLAG
ncbi:ABC transporter substrate-binding protein [Arenivirga flava]|uniref:Iron ABC transporter substrate-binding protein n=1 Tax=Arenivirga flava TaxID=1930060 RepID=A0AA37UP49_9MICO|nr:iron-siderophore ABC transporter substrate-binding protein [Arenivirga flava]GMA29480.1 iron ABC transporter substrate-binding protein [Arenivirga flava]